MIRLLTGGDICEVKAYLERNHMETVFINGNIDRCGIDNDRTSRRCGDYYGYFECGRLAGILTFFNLGSVIPHFESPGAVNGFVEIMRQRRFEVLAGMKWVVEPLNQALSQYKKISGYEDSYYFINREIKSQPLPRAGQITDAGEADRAAALGFVVEAYRQGFMRRFNRELAARLIDDRGPEEDLIFLLVDGVPKAQAIIQVTTNRINQIGGVYTSESDRGKGYCKVLVAELCRRIQGYGKTPMLMVRKDNAPAVKAYQSIGFTHYNDYLIVKYSI
ncbi:GNAT family N-acetyltransferase [Sporomusa sp.]|uniref:GNAT family N-acetyltransferase n=1 Tax=Sporomusa sp. TaxID=2078658 RepID=UPI002CEA2A6A|nr:GNAT family N-acetyltransferase [Sporomusa sp.]HWR42988.1 GNAT family N-acetyltransferase [Sporomusa sp.]